MSFLRRGPRGGDASAGAEHATAPKSGVSTPRQRAGAAAEDAAAVHLSAAGCRIVARNVSYREGELDIVAQLGSLLLFVEVRLRTSSRFGGALSSVDGNKRRRLLRAAQHYLAATYGDGVRGVRGGQPACRFDVIAVDATGVTDWIQDAFSAQE